MVGWQNLMIQEPLAKCSRRRKQAEKPVPAEISKQPGQISDPDRRQPSRDTAEERHRLGGGSRTISAMGEFPGPQLTSLGGLVVLRVPAVGDPMPVAFVMI
jgi:hypothetical protein